MTFSTELLKWYEHNRRILPWREDPSPYHVWLSEIMLQQTRVEAVRDYYLRFIEKLPDIRSLAEAPEDTYLKLWEGLGYYSRVRNLHRAGSVIIEEYNGEMPGTSAELMRLPGIGPYTAAAIASIAFGEAVPAVDGNLLRVFARLSGYEGNIRTPAAQKAAAEFYKEHMPDVSSAERKTGKGDPDSTGRQSSPLRQGNPYGNFNQALMDLGATVCLPNSAPECGRCPLAEACRIHKERPGEESSLPVMPDRKEKKTEYLTVFLIRSGGRTAVRKRPPRGLLAGLYEFPNTAGTLDTDEALKWLREHAVEPLRIRRIEDAGHIFTHRIWKMRGYEVDADPFTEEQTPFIMASGEEILDKYSIPSAFGAYLDRIKGEKVRF